MAGRPLLALTLFWSKAEAEAKAREMAKKRVASLEKQIIKMRKLAEKPKFARWAGEA